MPVAKKEHTRTDQRARIQGQCDKLLGKVTYMTNLVTFGNRFDRNQICPCGSGKKYKKCCIKNHDHNMWRLSRLLWAKDVLIEKIHGLGFTYGRLT